MSASRRTEQIPDGDAILKSLRARLRHPTPAAAAEALGYPITANRWAEIELPARPARLELWEAERIARAAGLHLDYFTAPVEHLVDGGEPPS